MAPAATQRPEVVLVWPAVIPQVTQVPSHLHRRPGYLRRQVLRLGKPKGNMTFTYVWKLCYLSNVCFRFRDVLKGTAKVKLSSARSGTDEENDGGEGSSSHHDDDKATGAAPTAPVVVNFTGGAVAAASSSASSSQTASAKYVLKCDFTGYTSTLEPMMRQNQQPKTLTRLY